MKDKHKIFIPILGFHYFDKLVEQKDFDLIDAWSFIVFMFIQLFSIFGVTLFIGFVLPILLNSLK